MHNNVSRTDIIDFISLAEAITKTHKVSAAKASQLIAFRIPSEALNRPAVSVYRIEKDDSVSILYDAINDRDNSYFYNLAAEQAVDVHNSKWWRNPSPIQQNYIKRLRRHGIHVDDAETLYGLHFVRPAYTTDAPPMPAPTEPAQDLKPRELDSLLKILFGMAIAAPYQYKPDSARNEATSIIASATAAAGCPVDADTVRKYLKMAAERVGAGRR